jgi:hypothetical protein
MFGRLRKEKKCHKNWDVEEGGAALPYFTNSTHTVSICCIKLKT